MTTDKYLNYEGAAALAAQIKKWGCEFIRGTNTTSTNALTGVTVQTALYDGMAIDYYLPIAENGSNATLELTLPGGSTTGAIPVFLKGTTRLTSHYPQHSIIRMVYNQSRNEWQCIPNYWANSTYAIYTNGAALKAKTAIYRYQICLTYNENYVLPINTIDNNTGTSKTLTTEEFDPYGPIYFYNSTTTNSADTYVTSQRLYTQYIIDLRYSFNTGSTLTAYKYVYLVAQLQSNGKAKLYSAPISQTLPTTDDGLIYILLGFAYNTASIYLLPNHPVYQFKNGKLQTLTLDAATVNGHTVESDVPSDAVFTDTTYNEATTSTSGLLSSSDKDKLDSLDETELEKMQQLLAKETGQTAILSWQVGTIDVSSGANSTSTTMIRTTDFLKCSQYTRIQVDSDYKYCIYVYSTNNTSAYLGCFDGNDTTTFTKVATWLTSPTWLVLNNDYYIKVVLTRAVSGTMTTSENIGINIYGFNQVGETMFSIDETNEILSITNRGQTSVDSKRVKVELGGSGYKLILR